MMSKWSRWVVQPVGGRAASGMEARQGGDVKQAPSRSDDSPTAESGDAQTQSQHPKGNN